jgi:hypothetical protein
MVTAHSFIDIHFAPVQRFSLLSGSATTSTSAINLVEGNLLEADHHPAEAFERLQSVFRESSWNARQAENPNREICFPRLDHLRAENRRLVIPLPEYCTFWSVTVEQGPPAVPVFVPFFFAQVWLHAKLLARLGLQVHQGLARKPQAAGFCHLKAKTLELII